MTMRIPLVVVCAAILALTACGGGTAGTQGSGGTSVTLRCSVTNPVGSEDMGAATAFKDKVEAETNGRVKLQLYPNSTLGDYASVLRQIHEGTLGCLYESLGVLGTYTPIAGIEAVPYLYKSEDAFVNVWNSPVGTKILSDVESSTGFKALGPAGFRGFRETALKQPVHTVDDLRGMKIRVPAIPAYVDAWKALGANPTPIAYTETYTAIQQGVVVGVENPLSVLEAGKFYEVTKYLIMTNHMAEPMVMIMQAKYFNSLDKGTQKAFQDAAVAMAEWSKNYTDTQNDATLKLLQSQGMTVIYPDLPSFLAKVANYKVDPALQPYVDQVKAMQ